MRRVAGRDLISVTRTIVQHNLILFLVCIFRFSQHLVVSSQREHGLVHGGPRRYGTLRYHFAGLALSV